MKNKDAIFDEIQRLKKWYLLLIFIPVNLIFITGCIIQIGLGKPWGSNPMPDVALIITTVFFLLFTANTLFVSMQTFIDKEGVSVSVSFCPFYGKTVNFLWEDIVEAQVIKYSPIRNYGGWGIRFRSNMEVSPFGNFRLGLMSMHASKNDMLFSMSGNMGLQLSLQGGKKVLIGTNNPDELSEVLYQLGKTDRKQYG